MNRTEFRNTRGDEGRARWGPGPWQEEPDKVTWIDDATALDCMIVRNHWGAWCGYVGVPPDHVAHGKGYDDSSIEHVRVHGGLTFAGLCDESEDPAFGICHVPLPGRPENVYWLGFDCGHAWDLQPEMEELNKKLAAIPYADDDFMKPSYKTVAYATAEVTQLAAQLVLGRPVTDLRRFENLEVDDADAS